MRALGSDVRLAARVPSVAVAGVARSWTFMIRTADGAHAVNGSLASAEAFQALGVTPLAGRLIAPNETRGVVALRVD